MSASVSAAEVAAVLRKVIAGEAVIKPVASGWDETYCGDVAFRVEGWEVVIFNDCDDMDYIDSVTAPDGRVGGFDNWSAGDSCDCPLDLLSHDEHIMLEWLLELAK